MGSEWVSRQAGPDRLVSLASWWQPSRSCWGSPSLLSVSKMASNPAIPAQDHAPIRVRNGWQPIPIPARFRSEGAEHDLQPDIPIHWVAKASWHGSEHCEAQLLVEPDCVGVGLGDGIELHAPEAAGSRPAQ